MEEIFGLKILDLIFIALVCVIGGGMALGRRKLADAEDTQDYTRWFWIIIIAAFAVFSLRSILDVNELGERLHDWVLEILKV